MKTSETTRPTLSSLPVGKRAEEGTPHNLFTVIGLDDSPSPYLSPSVKALIDQGCVFSGGARHHDIVAPLLPAGAKWIDITVPLDRVFARYAGHPHIIVFASGDPIFSALPTRSADVCPMRRFGSIPLLTLCKRWHTD